jgi:hypothetical protein
MRYLNYILLFLIPFFVVGTGIIAYIKASEKLLNITLPNLPPITIQNIVKLSRFSLEKAPSKALVGSLTSVSGEVNYEPRLATESAKLERPVLIQQGDILETGENGTFRLVFKDAAEINVLPLSAINIAQTLPANIVIVQSGGEAAYKKNSTIPLSLRVLHLLIEVDEEANVLVETAKSLVTVKSVKGDATLAFNNLNNETQIIKLEEGATLVFNDRTRKTTVSNSQ